MAIPMGDEMMAEEPEAEAPAEPTDDFSAAAAEAFPDLAGDTVRLDALKTAIRLCLEEDKGGGYDKEKPEGDTKLALLFGPKPKKG